MRLLSLSAATVLCSVSLSALADPQPQPWRTAEQMEIEMARTRAESLFQFELRDVSDLDVLRKGGLAHVADALTRLDGRTGLADFAESSSCPGAWVVTAPANPNWGNWNIVDPSSWWTDADVQHCMEAQINTVYCRDPDCRQGIAFKYRKVWQLRPARALAGGSFRSFYREGEYAWYVGMQRFADSGN